MRSKRRRSKLGIDGAHIWRPRSALGRWFSSRVHLRLRSSHTAVCRLQRCWIPFLAESLSAELPARTAGASFRYRVLCTPPSCLRLHRPQASRSPTLRSTSASCPARPCQTATTGWSLEAFVSRDLPEYLARCAAWRDRHEASRSPDPSTRVLSSSRAATPAEPGRPPHPEAGALTTPRRSLPARPRRLRESARPK